MANDFGMLMPFLGAALGVMALVFLAFYIYGALALMYIAKRTDTANAWLAWIPIANLYLMLKIGKLHWAWIFVIFLPIIPLLGSLLMAVAMVYIWWKIAEARNKPGWWGILMLIPIVNLILMGILAWGE
jgi:hypothetical protein